MKKAPDLRFISLFVNTAVFQFTLSNLLIFLKKGIVNKKKMINCKIQIQLADLLASQIVVIPWGDLRLGARLGAGSSGEVFRGFFFRESPFFFCV